MSGHGIDRSRPTAPPVRADTAQGDEPHHAGGRAGRRAHARPHGMPPPLSARLPAAAGPVRRASLPSAGEVLPPAQATGAGSNPKSVFEEAIRHVTAWRTSVMSTDALHDSMEAPAFQAMEAAQSGLDAWNELPGNLRRTTMQARNSLLDRRADAALIGLLVMPGTDVGALVARQVAGLLETGGSTARRAAFRERLGQELQPLEQTQRRLHAAHAVLLDARLNKRPLRANELDTAINSVPLSQFHCSGALLNTHLVRLTASDVTPDIEAQLSALHQFITRSAPALLDAVNTLTGDAPATDTRAAAADTIERQGELLAALAERFCFAAAQEAGRGGTPELWQHALACADAISGYFSPLLDLAAAVPRAGTTASSSVTVPGVRVSPPDDWGIVLPPASQGPGEAAGKKKSRGRTRAKAGGSARRTEGASGTPQPQATAAAAPDPLVRVLERAEKAVAAHPLTLAQAAQSGCDPVRCAAAQGKDTTVVALMKSEGHDPLSVAHTARFFMPTWFGDIGPLRSAHHELLSRSAPDDARAQRLCGQLGERIEALERLHRQVDADEADAIKCHAFPKARHVKRLMQLGAIEQVSAPKRLRSGDTPPGLGTVFEMEIAPSPLSDGSRSDPLYLHLHTDRAISAEACGKLPFEQFAAVHVKTAAQKNVGAKWEEAQRRLGVLDAKVHRGKVDAPLLESLRNWPGRQRDSGGPSR